MTGPQLYALFQGLALLTALLLRKRSTLPWKQQAAILAGALFGAGLGSKLPFVLAGGGLFMEGKTILSGFAGGYLGVEVAKLLAGIKEKTGDAVAMPLAAAVAVGRWGCYFNGCCAPMQLPESGFHAMMAVLLWRLQGVERLRWQLLKLYLIAYSVFRFATEFVRHEPKVALGLTAYQYGAAALAVVMALLWRHDERLKRSSSSSL